jgi:dipeptidyl aminopeptidase/acylaminoacyl peptidase
MKRTIITFCLPFAFFILTARLFSQTSLSIEKIMKGEKFTGFSPEDIHWSPSGRTIYFNWNKDMDNITPLYSLNIENRILKKVGVEERKELPSTNGQFNRSRSKMVFSKAGDLYLMETQSGVIKRITTTSANENNPLFSQNEGKILFTSANNLFSWEINSGNLTQLTDFKTGKQKAEVLPYNNENDKWLYDDQLRHIRILAERKEVRDQGKKEEEALEPGKPKVIYTGSEQTSSVKLSPDENYITYQSYQFSESKRAIVPSYVTESGYTEDIQTRSKVGTSYYSSVNINIYDLGRDTIYQVKLSDIPGLDDLPDYVSDYPLKDSKKSGKRSAVIGSPVWSDDGNFAVVDIFSDDNKDRWIMMLDIKTGGLKLLERQHDDAWIDGPGIRYGGPLGWLPDNRTIFFQSEESGFSHLYTFEITTGQKKALTTGNFEIYDLMLSNDKKSWYFISNEADPGIRELYRLPVKGGTRIRLTSFEGGIEYVLSPDEKNFALRVSHATAPWELYMMENKEKALPVKVTESVSEDFRSYSWRNPDIIRFRTSDGTLVSARLFKPDNYKNNGPAVIFVHGAGYLQNAHRWWSNYSREYMFHNFLVDNGYIVLDIDYRGSAGYGRDWRTAIYRHMGGKDLDDQADGAKYLVEQFQVDPGKIGIYGGSYGGFITLMAMFTKPGIFKAGAALRSVTDWAHYNHGYTSNILNTPVADSLAYVKSSPIYYAEGLEGALLICHGMIDDNVHFQDVVRLTQRLIELGKENWEMAVYPLERHGFVESTSWTDEYKRIFKLFEENLK